MNQRLRAIYQNGTFIPLEPFDLPEDSEVELTVYNPYVILPQITEPSEREAILKDIKLSMEENPLPAGAPNLSREDLHERR
ncbi:MAG: antitoxin family protein [Flavisolibacter sp.]|nr:antitoxin family protein [Flavisolibacter sp.]